MLNPIDINKRNLNFNPITIMFRNKGLRKKFYDFSRKYSIGRVRLIFGLFFITIAGMLLDSFTNSHEYMDNEDFSLVICFCISFLIQGILLVFIYETHPQTTNFFVTAFLFFYFFSIFA